MNIGIITKKLKDLKGKDPRVADIRSLSITSNEDVVVGYRGGRQLVISSKLKDSEIAKKALEGAKEKAEKAEKVVTKVVKKVKKAVKKK